MNHIALSLAVLIAAAIFSAILIFAQPLWTLIVHPKTFYYDNPLENEIDRCFFPALFSASVTAVSIIVLFMKGIIPGNEDSIIFMKSFTIISAILTVIVTAAAFLKTRLARNFCRILNKVNNYIHVESVYPKTNADDMMNIIMKIIVPAFSKEDFINLSKYENCNQVHQELLRSFVCVYKKNTPDWADRPECIEIVNLLYEL